MKNLKACSTYISVIELLYNIHQPFLDFNHYFILLSSYSYSLLTSFTLNFSTLVIILKEHYSY